MSLIMGTIDTIRRQESAASQDLQGTVTSRLRGLRAAFLAMIVWIEARAERQRSRRQLLELSDAQLKDIGLTRGDAWREGVRPFWD